SGRNFFKPLRSSSRYSRCTSGSRGDPSSFRPSSRIGLSRIFLTSRGAFLNGCTPTLSSPAGIQETPEGPKRPLARDAYLVLVALPSITVAHSPPSVAISNLKV